MVAFSRAVSALGVLLAFVLVVQIAFTGVGQEIGPHWGESTELASTGDVPGAGIPAVAMADGNDSSVVAWIAVEAGTYRVRTAEVRGEAGDLEVSDPRTVATSETPIGSLDAARSGDRVALVWERTEANRVVLAVDGDTRVVSSEASVRTNYPAVTFVDGDPVVAYQEYSSEVNGWRGVVATPGGGNVSYSRFGKNLSPDAMAPTLTSTATGVVVAWIDSADSRSLARAAPLEPADGGYVVGESVTVGDARTVRTMSGRGQLAQVQFADAGGSTAWLLWVDLGSVNVARLGPNASSVRGKRTVAAGSNPAIGAAADGRWLTTMVVSDESSGSDVRYVLGGDGAAERGVLSRLPSNALQTATGFGPGPVAAWTESGDGHRLLVSAYRPQAETSVVSRLAASPMRFAFLGVTAIIVGAVTVAMMPWVAGVLLAGFLLTTRFSLDAVSGLVSWVAAKRGRNLSRVAVRKRIQNVHPIVPVTLFVVANVTALVLVLGDTGDAIAGVQFSNPIEISLVAVVVTGVVAWLLEFESAWKIAALFGYVQTVGIWVTAVPVFL